MPFDKDLEDDAPRKKTDPAKITLSADEREVLKSLQRLTWPKGSSRLLPSVVRQSMRNYNRFLRRFKKILRESRRDFPDGTQKIHGHYTYNSLHEFIQHKLAKSFQSAPVYIEFWFVSYHNKVAHWKGFNGKLRPFTFTSKEFQNEGFDLATEFGGNDSAKLWEQVMELMTDEG